MSIPFLYGLAIQLVYRVPLLLVQVLSSVGVVPEEFNNCVQLSISMSVLLDLNENRWTLCGEEIGGPLQHCEFVPLDVNFHKPDVLEIKVIKSTGRDRLLPPVGIRPRSSLERRSTLSAHSPGRNPQARLTCPVTECDGMKKH